jgi:hypothetical protein
METKKSERGQVLVLVLFAMVALLGFGALAVDMGMVYSVRRQAQNAADAAAMAMAYTKTNALGDEYSAALSMLAKNGFDQDSDIDPNADKAQDVQVWNPPISGPYAEVADKNNYYQIIVRVQVRKILAQVVFSGPEVVTVEAIAHATPVNSSSGGAAMFAIGQNVCPGIVFNGGSNTLIKGGGIISNSNGNDNSGSCASGLMTGSSGSIQVTNGGIDLSGSWIQNAGAVVSPAPSTHVGPSNPLQLPTPSCEGLPSRNGNTNNLLPGYYPGNIVIQNADVTMQPGFYCIDGNLTVNSGTLTGKNVTIYMTPAGGGVNFGGNAVINLSAGQKTLDAVGNNFGGVLIFMDVNNHNGVDMSGGNGTFYHRTIYAPGYRDPASQEKCNIGGSNTSVALRSNVICYTIGIAGNSSVTIDYRPAENYRVPPLIELSQ